MAGFDVLQEIEAVGIAQGNIDDGDIRMLFLGHAHGLVDGIRLGADGHVAAFFDDIGKPLPEHRVIFHQQDFDDGLFGFN